MPIRTLNFEITKNGINPENIQEGGVQGEHKVTQLEFLINEDLYAELKLHTANISGQLIYRFDGYDCSGLVIRSDIKPLTSSKVSYLLEECLTRHGGLLKVVLVISISKNENTEIEMFSYPALIRLKNLPLAIDICGEDYISVSTLAANVKMEAEDVLKLSEKTENIAKTVELSANVAKNSEDAAKKSEKAAEAFASNAEISKTQAVKSASRASNSEKNAITAEQQAEEAKLFASRSEQNASASASNAETFSNIAELSAASALDSAKKAEAAASHLEIVQTLGNSNTKVMSQKATSEAFDKIDNTLGCQLIVPIYGIYYNTSDEKVDINMPNNNNGWNSSVIPCAEGEKFYITGKGGDSPRLWCFIDSAGNVLANSVSDAKAERLEIQAPKSSAYLICNFVNSFDFQISKNKLTKDELSEINISLNSVFYARMPFENAFLKAEFYTTDYEKFAIKYFWHNYRNFETLIRILGYKNGKWEIISNFMRETLPQNRPDVETINVKENKFEYSLTINWNLIPQTVSFNAEDNNLPVFKNDCIFPHVVKIQSEIDKTNSNLKGITGVEIPPMKSGIWYKTNGSTVDINAPNNNAGWDSLVINCVEKDLFTLTGEGGESPRLWCFIDSKGNVLSKSISSLKAKNLEIRAPKDSTYLIINMIVSKPHIVYKGRILENRLPDDGYSVKDTILNKVTVDVNGNGDYTTIHDAYNAINDGAIDNQYEIIVFPGIYHENNIVPPAFSHTHGIRPALTIITSEGMDKSLSVIDQRWWSSKLSNLTIISHTKYCVHYDYLLDGKTIYNENLHLIQRGDNSAIIGGGTFDNGAKFLWKNCIFEGGDVHSHTSGNQKKFNNSHNVFDGCKLVNAKFLAQSTGGYGNCVYEINGTYTKPGDTTILINGGEANARTSQDPWTYFTNVNEWQIIGKNNKNTFVEFGTAGKGLLYETENENESIEISGTAANALFGVIKYKKGGERLKGKAIGSVYVDDVKTKNGADVVQMWARLGDCSTVAKTLTVKVGTNSQTYSFNKNYANLKTPQSDIIRDINNTITIAVLKTNIETEHWDSVNLEEKQFITVTDSNSVLKGCAVDYNGKSCKPNAENSDVYGIALEDGVIGETIPVWIGNCIKINTDGEIGVGENGVLTNTASIKIGKSKNGVFVRDNLF